MAIIERCWKRGSLKGHKKINPVYEQITKDISEGCVFPAVRENEIHLYYEGGRAFRVKPKSVKTHRKYNGECRDGEVSLCELTPGLYADIKERCRGRHVKRLQNGDCEEGWIVSRLFRRFSYWSRYAEREQPKLVDIEVRFRGKEKIDLLFLEDDGRLRFVEVKRQDDPRTRWRYDPSTQSKRRNPEVLDQIRGYEDVLKDGGKSIVDAYGQVPGILAEALELERFSEPIAVCPRVPLLVCRRDAKHGRNTWLLGELGTCENDEIGSRLVVDGGSIETGSFRTRLPSWCPDGQWERLNLREVFGKIDNLGADPTESSG